MTSLITQPQSIAAAALYVAEIRSSIGDANTAAAGPTTELVEAAADEVSTACAKLFSSYAEEFQGVVKQAAAFHQRFAHALAAAEISYAQAETANAAALSGALGKITSPIQSLLGGAAATSSTATNTTAGAGVVTAVANAEAAGQQIALIMGGSGLPIPSTNPTYVGNVFNRYIAPYFSGFTPQELFTPEGLYPLYGVKSLTLDQSVSQGLTILDDTLVGTAEGQLGLITSGSPNSVVVLGYSQSAIIASLEMDKLALLPATSQPSADQLSFVLLGDLMNPNGGLLARFPGFTSAQPLQIPSLGITFYGATPDSTIYPTNIYAMEYDGFSDFPRYPLNFLSDLNAFIGIETIHNTIPNIDPNALPAGEQLVLLQGSTSNPAPGGIAATNTNYYMITHPDLPLLAPLRAIPVIGNPIADLLQPDLTTIVNLGYGDPSLGYSTAPANVQTTFGLFPHVSQAVIAQDLITGAQQGATAFMNDISAEASSISLSSLPHTLTSMVGTGGVAAHTLLSTLAAGNSIENIIQTLQTATANIGNTISNLGATATSLIQPTLDITNAVVTTLPTYDIDLFLNGIGQAFGGDPLGGLEYSLIAPVAADAALLTLAGGFELAVVFRGVEAVADDVAGLI
jgi:hypothetical protein